MCASTAEMISIYLPVWAQARKVNTDHIYIDALHKW
jgi:hypothetical protein